MSRPQRSIDRTLTLTVILNSGVSLLLACAAFAVYDVVTLRRAMTREATTLAKLVGINSAVALGFDDAASATETLGALSAADQVLAAVIYDREGRVFARYAAGPGGTERFEPPRPGSEGSSFVDHHLDLERPIVFDGERIGTIFIRTDTQALVTRIERYLVIVVVLLAAASGAGALIARRLQRRVSHPLSALVEGSEAIASGDLSTRVAVATDDEIGVLARTFNRMAVGLRDLVAQARHSIGDVGEVARALQESGGEMALEVERQKAAISETAESVAQVSGSIREVGANVEQVSDSARETSSSILEMDGSIGEIASHMDRLADSIDTTSAAVKQVAGHIDEVVRGGDTLSAATDGALMRLHQLRASVEQVQENARQSQALSEESSQVASQGMSAVQETIVAMREISASFGQIQESVSRLDRKSTSIDEIIQVISSVAEQTSLLSLNAAIIAAQAGEHGKAFSVVADQVKNLAERTHLSARQIGELIRAVQEDTISAVAAVNEGSARVERGVQRSGIAGQVLERISEQTRISTDHVREISRASARQGGDLESVDQAMLEVKGIVERINRSTRDQHAATSEITSAIESIRSLGERVRTSTEEQRRASRFITGAVTGVATRIHQIAEATHAQAKSGETIQEALEVFSEVSEETRRRVEAINAMVDRLSVRAAQLEREIGRFKTE